MKDRPLFIVTLAATREMSDEEAIRALRRFLKNALRAYGLRAVSVEKVTQTKGE